MMKKKRCKYLNDAGDRCKNKAMIRGFCIVHLDKEPDPRKRKITKNHKRIKSFRLQIEKTKQKIKNLKENIKKLKENIKNNPLKKP